MTRLEDPSVTWSDLNSFNGDHSRSRSGTVATVGWGERLTTGDPFTYISTSVSVPYPDRSRGAPSHRWLSDGGTKGGLPARHSVLSPDGAIEQFRSITDDLDGRSHCRVH